MYLYRRDRLPPVGRLYNRHTMALQQEPQQAADIGLVIHHQHL